MEGEDILKGRATLLLKITGVMPTVNPPKALILGELCDPVSGETLFPDIQIEVCVQQTRTREASGAEDPGRTGTAGRTTEVSR
jgi:hypothetical protein